MSNSQKKATIVGVGLLSDFHLMYYLKKTGVEVGVIVNEESRNLIGDITKGIKLIPHVKLRFSSKEDKEIFSQYPSMPNYMMYNLNKYVLECSFDIESNSDKGVTLAEIQHLIENTITGLRLLKAGYIDSNVILEITEEDSKKNSSLYSARTIPTMFNPPYYLRLNEVVELKKILSKIIKVDFEKRKSFRIALSRFENSYYDIEDEDKLIDYMIAFEALFIEGKNRSQHDILPVACAMLLGKNQKEREKIQDILDYAYNLRNAIIHGADFKEKLRKDQYFNDCITEIEDLLRKSIKKLL